MKIMNNINVGMLEQVAKEAIMGDIQRTLQVEAEAPKEKLEEIEKLAYERCPAVFALTERVRLNTSLEVKK